MELMLFVLLGLLTAHIVKVRQQGQRIALLGQYLQRYQIESLMERLTQGYLRALGESDEQRRNQVWHLLDSTEAELNGQFSRFVADIAHIDATQMQVSKLLFFVPWSETLFPTACFDLRKVLAIHAKGIDNATNNTLGQSPRDKAFMMTAELFLMQHSFHWFCKSKFIASARLLARHQTPHRQVIDSVAPSTRQAYNALVN